jgi:hypothetical protein
MLWIRIGFNADSSPDPAFEVKSDLDLLPNLVPRVLMNKICKILQLKKCNFFKNCLLFRTISQSLRILVHNTRQCVGYCIALSPV